MFFLPALAFVGGLVAMGRTKPQTGVRKLICLGPRSGIVYPVEDFPEIGVVVVRATLIPAPERVWHFVGYPPVEVYDLDDFNAIIPADAVVTG